MSMGSMESGGISRWKPNKVSKEPVATYFCLILGVSIVIVLS